MMRLCKTTRVLAGLAFGLLLLTACTTQTVVAPPTADIPAVRTESAQTVVAKLTIAAALNPTATEAPMQAPQTIVITATSAPTEAAPAAPTATEAAAAAVAPTATSRPISSGGSSSGAVYPTLTPRTIPDNLTLISYSPEDLASFSPGQKFDGVWKVKNTGTTTWGTDYYIRYAGGTDMGEATHFYLKQSVDPGDTVDLLADLVAPSTSGNYVGYYEFCTPNADIIYRMYVAISVP